MKLNPKYNVWRWNMKSSRSEEREGRTSSMPKSQRQVKRSPKYRNCPSETNCDGTYLGKKISYTVAEWKCCSESNLCGSNVIIRPVFEFKQDVTVHNLFIYLFLKPLSNWETTFSFLCHYFESFSTFCFKKKGVDDFVQNVAQKHPIRTFNIIQ